MGTLPGVAVYGPQHVFPAHALSVVADRYGSKSP